MNHSVLQISGERRVTASKQERSTAASCSDCHGLNCSSILWCPSGTGGVGRSWEGVCNLLSCSLIPFKGRCFPDPSKAHVVLQEGGTEDVEQMHPPSFALHFAWKDGSGWTGVPRCVLNTHLWSRAARSMHPLLGTEQRHRQAVLQARRSVCANMAQSFARGVLLSGASPHSCFHQGWTWFQ